MSSESSFDGQTFNEFDDFIPGNERFTNELIELELNELNAGLLRDSR